MANWIEDVLSPLKTATGLLQEAIEIRDATKFRDTVGKLQTQILAAQQSAVSAYSAQTAMSEEISQLKAQVTRLEAWDAEKQRYELKDVGLGSVAYAIKESERRGEPPHQICAACYQHHRKSFLQPHSRNMHKLLICADCKAEIAIGVIPPSILVV